MPQAIAAVLVGAGVGATVATVAAYAITLVGTLALSSYQKRKAERVARAQFDAAQVDRMANVPTTVGSRELVLGRVRKGGNVFFRTSVGQYKELFVQCIAIAAHEIDAIEHVYFNGEPVDLNALGQVTTAPYGQAATISTQKISFSTTVVLDFDPLPGSVSAIESPIGLTGGHEVRCSVDGRTVTIIDPLPGWYFTVYYQYAGFNSFARIRFHYGEPGQQADPELVAMLPGVWTNDHRVSGVAYLVCHFAYNDTAFPSGLPNVTVLMRGAKVYDPRAGVVRWTENPALMMRHVVTHPQFGKRSGMTASEDARIIAAANACDTLIDYGAGAVAMFRAASVFPFGAAPRDVLDDLSQAMGGEWAYANGEYFVRAGVYQLPVMFLDDADLAVVRRGSNGAVSQSPISINPHRERNDTFNTVAIRIWDQAANYVETPITPLRADAFVDDDGAVLTQEVTMPAVFSAAQAYHIAGIMLRDSRDPLTVSLPFKMRAYPLEIFDTVALTLSRYGWAMKQYRILARTFSPEGSVLLTLKETNYQIYAYGAGFVPAGYSQNSGLPKPWDIHPPAITSISSGEGELIVQTDGTIVNSVRVTWAQIYDQSIANGGTVEVQHRVLPDGPWISVTAPGDATEVRFSGLDDLALILIRARTRNSLAVSDWSTQQLHQVVGKTEPPPNVENLSISADGVLTWSLSRRVPDLAGYVFRFHYGQNLDWNSAAPLHTGLLTDSPWQPDNRPGGVVTIMVKAQDTSGNQSFLVGSVVMNLGDPSIANVVESWDYKALGWPYVAAESSGWSILSGDPTANPLDSFYGSDNQTFYSGDTDPFYKAEAYAEMVYVTPPLPLASALAGSVMTLVADVQGIDLRIEYRFAGPGAFYGPDSDSFYGPDTNSRYGAAGPWQPWPGQLAVTNDVYQFRVTIGAGATRGILKGLVVTVDAPDIEEQINDLPVAAGGTLIPFTKPFTKIVNIQITLQANASSAVTAESTKTPNLSPKVTAYNAAHASVGGASVDLTIKGW